MRESLIDAAIERFGKRGFDAVGTREIAAAVGTPMSSITYHFGGKDGLYLAAAQHIFENMHDRLGPLTDRLPSDDAKREDRIAAICAVQRSMGEFMLGEESAPFALFVSREQQAPTPPVLKMMEEQMMPMMRELVRQVGLLLPDLGEEEAKATTLFIFGMAIGLRHMRASMGLLFGQDSFEGELRETLLGQLEASTRAILDRGRA